jgi:hypothetical protein
MSLPGYTAFYGMIGLGCGATTSLMVGPPSITIICTWLGMIYGALACIANK